MLLDFRSILCKYIFDCSSMRIFIKYSDSSLNCSGKTKRIFDKYVITYVKIQPKINTFIDESKLEEVIIGWFIRNTKCIHSIAKSIKTKYKYKETISPLNLFLLKYLYVRNVINIDIMNNSNNENIEQKSIPLYMNSIKTINTIGKSIIGIKCFEFEKRIKVI